MNSRRSSSGELPFARKRIDYRGRRVLVMGLGLFGGGVAVSRWLAGQGARVTVTDLRPKRELAKSVAALRGLDIDLRLGGHRERDFRRAEILIVSPAVPLESGWLRKVPVLDTELNIFIKECRSRKIIGVTGSNGKTTTCALIHDIMRRLGRSWLGGNIGHSLLEDLSRIGRNDPVILEISSFQLEALGTIGRSPPIAVVTNVTPNHLDRHGTMRAYAEAKRQIVAHQAPGDIRILHADLKGFDGPGHDIRFALSGADVTAEGDEIVLEPHRIDIGRRLLAGDFNVENMLAAVAATRMATGHPGWESAAHESLNTFHGVEHRLEYVCEVDGVRFYNDSIATNQESTIAALSALRGPILLILGGYDKKLPFDGLARAAKNVKFAALFGETAASIDGALDGVPRARVKNLDAAVKACVAKARPGDTVLLSPACASFGMFRNFVERGRRFKSIVRALDASA
jgi:UDP-N-acetylmuramoylalanine--D-glutamate ligase